MDSFRIKQAWPLEPALTVLEVPDLQSKINDRIYRAAFVAKLRHSYGRSVFKDGQRRITPPSIQKAVDNRVLVIPDYHRCGNQPLLNCQYLKWWLNY